MLLRILKYHFHVIPPDNPSIKSMIKINNLINTNLKNCLKKHIVQKDLGQYNFFEMSFINIVSCKSENLFEYIGYEN